MSRGEGARETINWNVVILFITIIKLDIHFNTFYCYMQKTQIQQVG